jgi:opacity protein-like surface antigen
MENSMTRISGTLLAITAACACAVSTSALADDESTSNLFGLYLGAGVGYSTVRSDDPAFGLPGSLNDTEFAWKLIAGVRPIPFAGAEFEYIDFGHPNHDVGINGINNSGLDSHPRAEVLYGVGYLPLPVPTFDVFGKLGVAELQTDVTTFEGTSQFFRQNESNTRLAYGVGVQSKAWGISFRAEYERISSQFGDPDAVTVSATWSF